MTTMGAIGTGFRAARAAKRADTVRVSGTRTERGPITLFFGRLGSALLTLVALACFCVAAFSVALWLGLIITGLALLVAEWRLSPGEPATPNANNRRV